MSALEDRGKEEIKKYVRFPGVWVDDIRDYPPTDYLIKGLIDRKSLTVIYGPPSCGKTFCAIDIAYRIACGITWRGRRVKQGLVVYIAAEAGESILRRFDAWLRENLSEAREDPVPLHVITRAANLLFTDDVEELITSVKERVDEARQPLALIVIDTLSRSIPGGDENAVKDMTRVIEFADRVRDEIKASTLIVHHSGKDDTKGARGSNSLEGAADTVLSVMDYVITAKKVRDGVAGETFGFKLDLVEMGIDADGDKVTTCVLVPTDAKPSRKRSLPAAAQIALTALREALQTHGQALPETSTIPHGVTAVELTRWREQFRIRYGSDAGDTFRKAFQRGREHLLKERFIVIADPYVWAV